MIPSQLPKGQALTITSGEERIVWLRVTQFDFAIRRFHYIGKKLIRISLNTSLGSSEDDEYAFRVEAEKWLDNG